LAVAVPDAVGDSLVGKHTLVLRLGGLRAMRWYRSAVAAAFLGLPVLVMAGLPRTVAFAAALPVPLALWRIWSVRGDRALRPEAWESFTFWSIALFVLTAAAELAGFMLVWSVTAQNS
jgi:1,4-dihydroxy-2-naphthoate octaprenyltransferase